MKTLEQRQWRRSGVFIANCEHILHFVLITDSEQANICWFYIKKTNFFKSKIGYVMLYVVVF